MKCLMILTVGVCLLLTSVPVMADQAADEAAIKEATKQLFAAYNAHDAKAFLARLDEDCEFWTSGKCRTRWEQGVPEQSKNGQLKLYEDLGVFFVTSDVAVHKYRFEYSGTLDAEGKPLPPGKVLRAWVYVKKSGKWLTKMQLSRPIEE